MSTTDPPRLICYDRGRLDVLAVSEAYARFWAYDFAWLMPLQFLRWSVDGHPGSAYVHMHAEPCVRRFAAYLFRRHDRCLTPYRLKRLEGTAHELGRHAFEKRMSRFQTVWGDLPDHLRPTFYSPFAEDGKRKPIPAYYMNPSRMYMLVEGAEGGNDEAVDWSAFETPPAGTPAPPLVLTSRPRLPRVNRSSARSAERSA